MAAAALVLSGGCARNTGSHSQYLLFFNVACMCLFDSNRIRAGVLVALVPQMLNMCGFSIQDTVAVKKKVLSVLVFECQDIINYPVLRSSSIR